MSETSEFHESIYNLADYTASILLNKPAGPVKQSVLIFLPTGVYCAYVMDRIKSLVAEFGLEYEPLVSNLEVFSIRYSDGTTRTVRVLPANERSMRGLSADIILTTGYIYKRFDPKFTASCIVPLCQTGKCVTLDDGYQRQFTGAPNC